MTGPYSIRNGLSLITIPGAESPRAPIDGRHVPRPPLRNNIFGNWHLGSEQQSLPTAHGFDEFYGIPPDISWDSATYGHDHLTHSFESPHEAIVEGGRTLLKRQWEARCMT
jgi:arylsulfatase